MIKKLLSFVLLLLTLSVCFSAYLPPISADKGMVVTAQQLASQVGVDILKRGGNAIDAAVAIGYALAVVQPCCGNIGGGGFMLVHLADGKNVFIDFREKAPAAIKASYFFDAQGHEKKDALQGYLPVGIPGTVMGLNTALAKYGTLPLKTVMAPAIQLAQQGYRLSAGDVCIMSLHTEQFAQQANVTNIFLQRGKAYKVGDLLVQKNLAQTLQLISNQGTSAFYRGPIAKEIVAASTANHGVLSLTDFADYTIQITNPIECNYRGYQVITSPPPGSGITVCEILNIVSKYPLDDYGFNSVRAVHYNIEAMRYAFADRNQYLGDPDFVKNPVAKLLSSNYADAIRTSINPNVAANSEKISFNAANEKPNTTHYVVIDKKGNAVSVTYTLNGFFGAGVIAGKTGFFLNNELNDFSLKAGVANQFKLIEGNANLIAPNKRPLSSMSPTIVMKNNKPFLLLGAAGGSTIITTIVETIENVVDWHMDINSAVNMPHYHMQCLPDIVYWEQFGFSQDMLDRLQVMGYHLQMGSFFNTPTWGQGAAILIDPVTGIISGAADNRRLGGAAIGISSSPIYFFDTIKKPL